MKRSGTLKRGRAINRRSVKATAYAEELAMMTPFVYARANGRCEFDGCRKHLPSDTVPHHRKRRSQGGTNSMVNLWLLCSKHHGFVHAHPEQSYEHGWLIRRDDPETPLETR